MGFREALVEEMEKVKLQEKSWKTIAKRVAANFLVLMLLGKSYTSKLCMTTQIFALNFLRKFLFTIFRIF